MADSTTIAAKVNEVDSSPDETRIRCPSPESAPAHSAKTAPMTATATAILAPLKMKGRAHGSSARLSVWPRPAPSVRIIFRRSGSTDRSPSYALTVIGKKQIRAMISNFGKIPKPNQTTRIGASTTIGIVCEATRRG